MRSHYHRAIARLRAALTGPSWWDNLQGLMPWAAERTEDSEFEDAEDPIEQGIVDGTELKAIVSINTALDDQSIREAVAKWMDPKTRQSVVNEYGDIGDWNTSQVTDMSWLFERRRDFNKDISRWDTGKVKNMRGMFFCASSFDQPLQAWDVSSVRNMMEMFDDASTFNQPLETWNVSSVKNMNSMFAKACSFNRPLEAWDVDPKVTNTDLMFVFAKSFKQRPTWLPIWR